MPKPVPNAAYKQLQTPTRQPLLGTTILLVEDSKYFSDAVRLLSIRSGARMRRADSLTSARRHAQIYRPDVVMVDMGLPDGSGLDFVSETAGKPDAPSIIAISGVAMRDAKVAALAAGADCFLEKPFFDLASFQQNILAVLPDAQVDTRFVPRIAGTNVIPDQEALHEDLCQMLTILKDAKDQKSCAGMEYVAGFLRSVGRVSLDTELTTGAGDLSQTLLGKLDWSKAASHLVQLVQTRVDAQTSSPL